MSVTDTTYAWPSGQWTSFSVGTSGTTTTMVGKPSGQYGTVTFSGTVVITGASATTAISTLQQGASSDTVVIADGATISGSTLSISNLVLDGGNLTFTGSVTGDQTAITFEYDTPYANYVSIPEYAFWSSPDQFYNFAPGSTVDFSGATISAIRDVSSGEIAVYIGHTNPVIIHTAINPATGSYFTARDFSYSGSEVVCFLAGTQISTPSGLVMIEDLRWGDDILAVVNGNLTPRRVTWVGMARCVVRPELPDDRAGYPVRICRDAIADNVPFKDMLITAEHCLFFDGRFVPARMLVNGRSIYYDRSITCYDYYHIETKDHAVIVADGVLTESYLDTGNRSSFRGPGNVVAFNRGRVLDWEDAAACLDVSRVYVEPLFRRIEARAVQAGLALQVAPPALTTDSGLHLRTAGGVVIWPDRTRNGRVTFAIPAGVTSVRVVSNASRPCDVEGVFLDDRRRLGVLVGEVVLFAAASTRHIACHLTRHDLSGWHAPESSPCRWTTGDAFLPLGAAEQHGAARLTLQILAAGPYIAAEPTESDMQALAG